MNKDIFSEFVGQSRVKNVLRFCLDCYKTSNYFAPLCVSAKRGDGKTYLCSLVAKELKKPHILINSSTVKSVTALVDEIIMPVATGSTNGGTLHFDESHFLNKGKGNGSIEGFLLSCIQPAKNHINTVQYAGGTLSIDTKKISFLFSTTNLENHGQAFLNRLRKISFAPYEVSDLEKIIKNNAEGIHFSPKLVHEIATVCRDTPRTAVLMANDIVSYTEITKNKQFTFDDWAGFRKKLNINDLGLEEIEITYLRLLNKTGSLTLSTFAAALEFDRKTLQYSVEPFLIKKGLLAIRQSVRHITPKGREVLNTINEGLVGV